MTTATDAAAPNSHLADRELHRLVERFVRRRVPDSEVADLVQTVLCAAVGAARIPAGHEDLRRWLIGIARHKIADHRRAAGRERPTESPQIAVEPAPFEARDLVSWAEREASAAFQAEQTLAWMALEGEGETLATIASEEQLPPPRVRKRVSRLRRTLRRRWLAELGLVAGVGLAALLAWQLWTPNKVSTARPAMPTIMPDPGVEHAQALREAALRACEHQDWSACLQGLDRAKDLDPAGDRSAAVGAARRRATEGLAPPKPPPTSSSLRRPVTPPARTSPTATSTPPAPKPSSTIGSRRHKLDSSMGSGSGP